MPFMTLTNADIAVPDAGVAAGAVNSAADGGHDVLALADSLGDVTPPGVNAGLAA